jgi:hypothetical protein
MVRQSCRGQEKKLIGAVDHWFYGDGVPDEELLTDAAAFGIELPASAMKPKEYQVWPEHEDVVLLFLRCQTQWRTTMMGVMGLDYGVILQMIDLYAVSNRLQAMEDLQVMEGRAKQLINEQVEKSMKTSTPGKQGR